METSGNQRMAKSWPYHFGYIFNQKTTFSNGFLFYFIFLNLMGWKLAFETCDRRVTRTVVETTHAVVVVRIETSRGKCARLSPDLNFQCQINSPQKCLCARVCFAFLFLFQSHHIQPD